MKVHLKHDLLEQELSNFSMARKHLDPLLKSFRGSVIHLSGEVLRNLKSNKHPSCLETLSLGHK